MIPAELKGPAVRNITSTITGVVIPVISARGLVFSAWTPSPEELAALAKGSPLWLVQRGPYIPDMTLRVGAEFDVIPHDLMRDAVAEATGEDPHEKAVASFKDRKRADIILGYKIMAVLALVALAVIVAFLRIFW